MKQYFIYTILLLSGLLLTPLASAGGVYQKPAEFINQVFNKQPPKASILWLKKDLKTQLAEILDHPYKGMRIRYWQQDQKTAWILEEIGKDKPITTGIVINRGKIEQIKILVFRESRGWEIRHDFFTDQFKQAGLGDDNQLDRHIDNISGATLSVRAIRKLARVALLLDNHIRH